MEPLLTASQMSEVDKRTIRYLEIPAMILMEHAALATANALAARFGKALAGSRGVVLAGKGNNGGDALACARILHTKGVSNLLVVLVSGAPESGSLAEHQLRTLSKYGVVVDQHLTPEILKSADWVVDGIFGTGLKREVTAKERDAIEAVNQASAWVVSIDIPSGLNADTGNPCGVAVRASHTVALGFVKRGLVTGDSADYVGTLELDPIQIPRALPFPMDTFWYTQEDARRRIPKRKKVAHKGEFGHVFVVAGENSKQGAAILSALGAFRCGVGLVTVVGIKENLDSLRPRLPAEVMTLELKSDFWEKPQGVLVLGPGLGLDAQAKNILEKALHSAWPLVLDADALTLLSENATAAKVFQQRKTYATVLTPHPKEVARLLNSSVEEVQKDRYQAALSLVEKYGVSAIVKGKGTVVRLASGPSFVISSGDSGLSKGGTGDLLTGVIASFLAQGMSTEQALPLACYIHGRASELNSQALGQTRSSLTSELAGWIPEVLKELEA